MGSEWIETKFSELCDISRGSSPRPIHDWIAEEGIPWVRISDASSAGSRFIEHTGERIRSEGRSKSVSVYPGDLILSNSATPGIPMFMSIEACIHDGWLLLRNFRGLDKTFAYYLLLHDRPALIQQGNGSVFTNLKTDILKNHVVRLPPLPEQRAIAAVLGALDDKIELNRRMNGTLEAMARALFNSWFVDFDPVRAKMGHRNAGTAGAGLVPAPDNDPTPEEGNHKGLPQPPDIAALFPDEMVVGEDGVERPLGWGVGTIGDIAENVRRGVQPENIIPGTPYIALEHMPRRSISLSDWGIADGLESNKSEFKHGEILFGKLRPYFHKVGVAPVDGVCSTDILVIRPQDPSWFGITLGHISSRELIDYTTALSTGTKMPRTNWHDIARYEITIPPVELAAKYSDLVLQFVQRIWSNIEESRTLAALRDALLPKLMSGEVRVSHAENMFGVI